MNEYTVKPQSEQLTAINVIEFLDHTFEHLNEFIAEGRIQSALNPTELNILFQLLKRKIILDGETDSKNLDLIVNRLTVFIMTVAIYREVEINAEVQQNNKNDFLYLINQIADSNFKTMNDLLKQKKLPAANGYYFQNDDLGNNAFSPVIVLVNKIYGEPQQEETVTKTRVHELQHAVQNIVYGRLDDFDEEPNNIEVLKTVLPDYIAQCGFLFSLIFIKKGYYYLFEIPDNSLNILSSSLVLFAIGLGCAILITTLHSGKNFRLYHKINNDPDEIEAFEVENEFLEN